MKSSDNEKDRYEYSKKKKVKHVCITTEMVLFLMYLFTIDQFINHVSHMPCY